MEKTTGFYTFRREERKLTRMPTNLLDSDDAHAFFNAPANRPNWATDAEAIFPS
jgi:hypothetical protein